MQATVYDCLVLKTYACSSSNLKVWFILQKARALVGYIAFNNYHLLKNNAAPPAPLNLSLYHQTSPKAAMSFWALDFLTPYLFSIPHPTLFKANWVLKNPISKRVNTCA